MPSPQRERKNVSAPPPEPRLRAAKTWSERLSELHPKRFFLETWRDIDAEAASERASRHAEAEARAVGYRDPAIPFPAPYDYRPIVALAFGAVCLALMEYFGHSPNFRALLDVMDPPDRFGPATNVWGELRDSQWLQLADFVWWSAWRVLGYFLLPVLLIKLVWRERIRDHGLETKGFTEHAWIYVLSYLVVFACVLAVLKLDPHFREYYPFYGYASRSWADLLMWEALYAAQFFSLEFFFRGFWLRAMKPALGSQAIFVMVVPYCMIHFGKPFLETLAAIIAGIVLGTLSMKTRSIWSGFLIHVSVAITMDVSALLATRGLPAQWWPG